MSAVEDRLADALSARAQLETVDAAVLAQRRDELRAAVDDDVVSLDGPGSDLALPEPVALGVRRRRLAIALVAAAAAVALAVAGLGALRSGDRIALPAGSVNGAYTALSRPQEPSDLASAPAFGLDVVRDSVRRLGRVDDGTYYAATTPDQRLCWTVVTSSPVDEGGCYDEPRPPEPVQLSGADAASAVWLLPDGYDSTRWASQSYAEVAANLWAPGEGSGTVLDQFAVLRAPQAPSDGFAQVVAGSGQFVDGSERVLLKTEQATYWAARDGAGQVCLVVLLNATQSAGITCASPRRSASDGVWLRTSAGAVNVTAWLVPDALDTPGWGDEGRIRVARNVWVETETGQAAALADVARASQLPFAVAPLVGTGSQALPVFAVDGPYSIVIRCLGAGPVGVEVNGVPVDESGDTSFTDCTDGMRSVGREGDGSATAVTVSAPPGSPWAAGVVRCTAIEDGVQC